MTQSLNNVIAELENLGSPDAIARRLEKVGIKANKSQASSCAIAQYVKREGYDRASVTSTLVMGKQGNDPFQQVNTLHNVSTFIRLFDDNAYPQLVA